MHEEIRRKDRALTEEEARAVLEKGEYGFLAVATPEDGPYCIPLSYTVTGNTVYFHSATAGKKITALAADPRVCFTVVGDTEPVYDNSFSTYYESCVLFGKVRLVTDDAEKRAALMDLAQKYLPDHMDKAPHDIEKSWKRTVVYAMDVTLITGKSKKRKA